MKNPPERLDAILSQHEVEYVRLRTRAGANFYDAALEAIEFAAHFNVRTHFVFSGRRYGVDPQLVADYMERLSKPVPSDPRSPENPLSESQDPSDG